jgi:RNA-directed DNA polymerase
LSHQSSSPLLANIYLHVFDQAFTAGHPGRLVRYADDAVILCRTRAEAEDALRVAGEVLRTLGLELHPEKTKVVDLTEGREGFDFLGWHFRARVSGRLLERGVRRYYLHRWPSTRAMNAIRSKVKALTGRGRAGQDLRLVIRDLNPVLRGWGTYFRTGNAAQKFNRIDGYVWRRLTGLLRRRYGRNFDPRRVSTWTADWLVGLGLHRLRGTVRYPEVSLL